MTAESFKKAMTQHAQEAARAAEVQSLALNVLVGVAAVVSNLPVVFGFSVGLLAASKILNIKEYVSAIKFRDVKSLSNEEYLKNLKRSQLESSVLAIASIVNAVVAVTILF